MSGATGRRLRPRALSSRARGFTLIELVTSFVVFAFAFGVLMEIATSSMRAARRSAAYTQAALQNGSDREQMTEAVHVACAIRGGASLVHGVQMRNVADKVGM